MKNESFKGIVNEKSPPGWGGTTSAMMKHHKKDIDNPWALAYWMKKRDFKSHYKNDPEGTKSKKEPEKKDDNKPKKKIKFKEWLDLRELNEHKKKKGKKGKLTYVFNIEGEPTEIEEAFDLETARVAHSAITKLGYGIGRPKMQGDSMVYNTPDPEDAEMIAGEVTQQLARWGIKGMAIAQGTNLIVTLN